MNFKDIQGCVLIIGLAMGLGIGVNWISPHGIALFGQWDPDTGVVMAGSNQENHLVADELNNPLRVIRMVQAKTAVLVDVRRADIYAMGHIPGAVSFPLYEFDTALSFFLDLIKKQDTVLVYCAGVECQDSHAFASRLIQMGFVSVKVYAGGFREWKEMGFEVEADES
ncbi:MAG: rhodanese-like domain-containing protein [Desulfobacter sp.]|nr:MAG: rhodanese-like domain-containing protein [Desulfobacter sp.]